MKTLRPNQLDEFFEIFDSYSNSGLCYYRGQADFAWDILPGLFRNEHFNKKIEVLNKIEDRIIERFQQEIKGNNLSKLVNSFPGSDYHQTWILLMAAQHYGLPTRLLDFSHDKFAALEFAVDLNYLDKDGALIIYECISCSSEETGSKVLKCPFTNDAGKTFFFQGVSFYDKNGTPSSEHRKSIQGSKFLYCDNLHSDLSKSLDHSGHLTKIEIDKRFKPDLIRYLIGNGRMAYDLYSGKDENDFHAAIIKQEFKALNQENIEAFLRK